MHIECNARTDGSSIEQDGITLLVWEHFGKHEHGRPPGGRLSNIEEEEVDIQVGQRHESSVHALRTGDTGPGSVPLGEISSVLANPRAARYQVSKSKRRQGLTEYYPTKGIPSFLGSFTSVQEKLKKPFIIDSSIHGPTYLTFQTPFMKRMLEECVDDWSDPSSDGRHGLVTDGDHSYFKEGVLNVSCAFNSVLSAWVPVLYTWILKLDVAHH